MSSFIKIQRAVTQNIQRTSIEQQFNDKLYLTSLFFSQLAYFKFSYVEKKLQELGSSEYSFYNKFGTQGLFAKFDDVAVVSFRGTETNRKDDLKTIFSFWRTPYKDIKIHSGFYKSLNGVIETINADLDSLGPSVRTIYTGHSMGGALATLLAYLRAPTELCTFGEPKISGEPQFLSYMQKVNYHRLVTQHDWIRFLPVGIPKMMPYQHAGTEKLLPSKWNWKNWVEPHQLSTYNQAIIEEGL